MESRPRERPYIKRFWVLSGREDLRAGRADSANKKPDILGQAFDAGRLAPAHFGIDLGNVQNEANSLWMPASRVAVSASLPDGAISVMRWRISNEMRWGDLRLSRPDMALTCRFIDTPYL